jgi:hypothetical protein
MTPYELELVAIAKNRGDSVTRQLAEILQKQDAQIAELETGLKNVWEIVEGKQTEIEALQKQLYFKDYYEELPDTPVDLLRKAQKK